MRRTIAFMLTGALLVAACSKPQFPGEDQYGPTPRLPEPTQYLFPPMGIAKPVGFKANETPIVPAGFTVRAFARDLNAPRRVLPLPNGDVLVVESSGPGIEPVLRPKNIIYRIIIGAAHSPGAVVPRALLRLRGGAKPPPPGP